MTALAVLARVGEELLRLGRDRLDTGLPRRIEDVDARDLAEWTGLPVTRVERLDATSGTTDRARFALEGPDAPPSVFVKMPAAKAGIRLFGYLAGLGENE